MTPSDALKARRSSSGERVRNTPVPILACDAHACSRGPPHGSRRSINQRVAIPAVAIPATRWAECGGPLLTTTCGWNRRITERAQRGPEYPAAALVREGQERRDLAAHLAQQTLE